MFIPKFDESKLTHDVPTWCTPLTQTSETVLEDLYTINTYTDSNNTVVNVCYYNDSVYAVVTGFNEAVRLSYPLTVDSQLDTNFGFSGCLSTDCATCALCNGVCQTPNIS